MVLILVHIWTAFLVDVARGGGGTPLQEANGDVPLDRVTTSTLDLYNTSAALYQLSLKAKWEQVIELVRYKPVKG